MKQILILLLALCSLTGMAQQYPVSSISITLPPQPKPNTGDWAMPFIITAQAKLVNGQVPGNLVESRILLTIKKDGAKFCSGFTSQNAPMSVFNAPTKTWSGGTAFALLGNNCFMPPGNYELCVQFFTSSIPVMPLSNEVCKSFNIQDRNSSPVNYTAPQNIMPVDGKVFTKQEANLPIMFRWTPVQPKPKEDVIYKVRLYEVAKGTSKAQAIKSGSPVETIEVKNITQTSFKLAPRCNNCEWVWNVEAISVERVQGGEPRSFGTSQATSFTIAANAGLRVPGECKVNIDSIRHICDGYTTDGKPKYKMFIYLKNNATTGTTYLGDGITTNSSGNDAPTTSNGNYLQWFQVSDATITNINPLTNPTLTNIANGATLPITFDLVLNGSVNIIKFKVLTRNFITQNGNTTGSLCPTTESDTLPPCRCEFCDALTKEHFSQAEFNYSDDNNSLQLNQMLNLPTQFKIKQLKAEIITFDWQTDNPECRKCQKDDNQFGVIIDGTLNRGNTILNGSYPDGIPNSHELDFNCLPADGVVLNNGASVNLNISLPLQTTLSCCQDKFTFCIRYTIVTTDCKTCSIVKCYTQVPPRQHKLIINNGGGN